MAEIRENRFVPTTPRLVCRWHRDRAGRLRCEWGRPARSGSVVVRPDRVPVSQDVLGLGA